MIVVIMAGGMGTRISSIAREIPKPMIKVNGIPVLEMQINLAKRYGFTDFILVTGHLGKVISAYFGDGKRLGVSISYYQETNPLGNAGALYYLKDRLTEDFFLFYGDTVMDIALDRMLEYHFDHASDATLYLHPNDHPYDSDLVAVDSNNHITGFFLKPHSESLLMRNLVNAALYILSPKVISHIPPAVKSSFEKDIFPGCLSSDLSLYGYLGSEYIKDMGTPERYHAVCRDAASGKIKNMNSANKRKAVFLDRDGTINQEVNLCHRIEDFKLIDGAADAVKLLNDSGILAIIVTNQPVIARNLCRIDELEAIHAHLEKMLGKVGAYVDRIYYCPHHPDKGYPEERKEYKITCDCRKPSPGMILTAAVDFNIDLSSSWMVGDSESDILAGEAAGLRGNIRIEQNKPGALLAAVRGIINDNFANTL